MKRWVCPTCGAGVLAPERLAKLDVRRWCLRCSAKSPTLVERSIPSRAAERERAAEARKRATERRQERRAARTAGARDRRAALLAANDRRRAAAAAWLEARIPLVLGLGTWRRHRDRDRAWPPTITIRQGGAARRYASGHAWWSAHAPRLVVTTGHDAADDLATLVHEVAHIVDTGATGVHGHSFRAIEAEAIGELVGRLGEVTPSRGAGRPLVAVVRAWLGPEDPALHPGDPVAPAPTSSEDPQS